MTKQLAIIKNVSFGVRDTNYAILSFFVWLNEGSASLICLSSKQAVELIEKHQIADISYLEGKPCWVEADEVTVHFLDLAKI